jgi:phosphatidylserine/phosphatidylglycerophosphate/cardiolipin synthase-like enzyme
MTRLPSFVSVGPLSGFIEWAVSRRLLFLTMLALSLGLLSLPLIAEAGQAVKSETKQTPESAAGEAVAPTTSPIEEFELVESVPVETGLDNKNIRNTYEVWLEMINRATRTLDFEEFYVSNSPGEPLEDVLEAVIGAAKRGVQVRFAVDAGMYRTYPEMLDSLDAMDNINVRKIDMRRISGGPMHAKYFIVDGGELFIGSQNFDWRALKHIHELGCRVRSKELCQVFSDLFELDWGLTDDESCGTVRQYDLPLTGKVVIPFVGTETTEREAGAASAHTSETITVWPVYSPGSCIPDSRQWDEARLVSLMDSAQDEVLVQLLTYSALDENGYYEALDAALRRAAGRGASVKLLISDWVKASRGMDCLKSLEVLPNVEVKLSTIPEWSGGYIPYARVEHCKYMVVDGATSWVGTSNWDRSYFHSARNAGLVIQSTALGRTLHDVFYKSWDSEYTYELRPEVTYVPPKRSE